MFFNDFLNSHNISIQYFEMKCYVGNFVYFHDNEYIVGINLALYDYILKEEELVNELINIFKNNFYNESSCFDNNKKTVSKIIQDLSEIVFCFKE